MTNVPGDTGNKKSFLTGLEKVRILFNGGVIAMDVF